MPKGDAMRKEGGVVPEGEFTAWSITNGMRAEVRDHAGKVVQKMTGEMAWQEAVREAGDLNARARSRERYS